MSVARQDVLVDQSIPLVKATSSTLHAVGSGSFFRADHRRSTIPGSLPPRADRLCSFPPFTDGITNISTEGLDKSEAHTTSDDQMVNFVENILYHRDLGGNF